MQTYNTEFTLSRDYLSECFDQSLPYGKNAKPNYLFPIFMLSAGLGVLNFTELSQAMGFMLIALALIELLHIRYRKAWWLTRQMWGKNAGSTIKLSIDEEGIKTQSPQTQTEIMWEDIADVIETDLGLILVTQLNSQQYLSKSLFTAELIEKIVGYNKH